MTEPTILSVVLHLDEVAPRLAELRDRVEEIVGKPKESTEGDDFHATLAYAEVPSPENLNELAKKARRAVSSESWPMKLRLGSVSHLINQDEETVLYVAIESASLTRLAKKLRKTIEAGGGKFTFPDWKGHVTLGYYSDLDDDVLREVERLKVNFNIEVSSDSVDVTTKDEQKNWKKIARMLCRVVMILQRKELRI